MEQSPDISPKQYAPPTGATQNTNDGTKNVTADTSWQGTMQAGWSLVRLAWRTWCGEMPSYDHSCQTSTDYRQTDRHTVAKTLHSTHAKTSRQYGNNIISVQMEYFTNTNIPESRSLQNT